MQKNIPNLNADYKNESLNSQGVTLQHFQVLSQRCVVFNVERDQPIF